MSDAELVIRNPEFRIFGGSLLNPIQQAYIEKWSDYSKSPQVLGNLMGNPCSYSTPQNCKISLSNQRGAPAENRTRT